MTIEVIGGPVLLPNGVQIPLSKAMRAGDYIFFSGQLGLGADGKIVEGGIEAQTKQCLDNIQSVLNEAGAKVEEVVKATIWLTNTSDFAAFNKVYSDFFSQNPPTRSCVASGLMLPEAVVEIEIMVYQP